MHQLRMKFRLGGTVVFIFSIFVVDSITVDFCELTPELCTNDCGHGNQTFHGKCDLYEQSFTFPCANYTGCSADWSTWAPVGTCSTTCNDGQLEYQRWCNTTIPRPVITNCVGSNVKYEVCNQGTCPVYKWGHLKELNLTKGDLKEIMKEELDELKRNLTINSKNISATIRKRICARDDRPSAASVGYVGIVLLLIPIVIIISVDAPKFFAVVTHICRKVCKRKVVKKAKVQRENN